MASVSFSLDGKIAIVTGGSKGIGRAIALAFAEHGADVAIAARGADAPERTRQELVATGRRALAVQADMADDADVEKFYHRTIAELGGVDILVNNVTFSTSGAPYAALTRDVFLKVFQVNLWTAFSLGRLCHDSMVQRGGGVIINITSNEGIRPTLEVGGPYGYAKAGLINLTQDLAKKWGNDGIRVSCIAPGLIRTEAAQRLVELVESTGQHFSITGRIGEPHEIAGMALYLASPAGAYATGMTYVVDGGEVC